MKSLITALVLTITSYSAIAQQKVNMPLSCFKITEVDKVIKQYKESPIFIGKDRLHGTENLNVTIFLNAQTRTYTLLLLIPDSDIVCVISSGEDGKLIFNQ